MKPMKSNRKKWLTALCLCLCFALCAGNVLYAQATETRSADEIGDEMDQVDDEITELESGLSSAVENRDELAESKSQVEKYLDSLNSTYQTVSSQLSQVQTDISAKETQIAQMEEQIAAKQAEIADTQGRIEELEQVITAKRAQIEQTEEDLAEQYESMKLRIQYMYENSSAVQYLEMLMSSDNLITFLNRVEYIQEMIDYDERMMVRYEETADELNAQKAELESAQDELEEQKAGLESENAELEEQNADLQQEKEELEELQSSLKKQQSTVASQQASSATELQNYVDELVNSDAEITSYEEKIAAKREYYNELLAQKLAQEQAEATQKAQEEADNTSGNITVGDSGINSGASVNATDDEQVLLAAIIYCEAGGESYEGQLAVGYVIMNRVRSSLFPNTITGVVYEAKQFEPVSSGRLATVLAMEADPDVQGVVTDSCRRAAAEVLTGTSNVGESLFFRTWKPVPQLITNLENAGVPYYIIGNHIFYYRWVSY